jgi:hypothetical protein
MTISDYDQLKAGLADPLPMEEQIDGLMNGIEVANNYNSLHGVKQIFCQPPNLGMTVSEEGEILDDYIKQLDPPPATDLSVVALEALQYAFPCQ